VTPDDRIAGFARLSLPRFEAFVPELVGRALLRELHVYGPALELGRRDPGRAQHAGLGQRLVAAASERAADAGFPQMAVISAVGTRPYYRRLGFRDGDLYPHRETRPPRR
jgi:elongator complex protein 3